MKSESALGAFPHDLKPEFFVRLAFKAQCEAFRSGLIGKVDPLDLMQEVILRLFKMWQEDELETHDGEALLHGLGSTMLRCRAIDAARRSVNRVVHAARGSGEAVGSSIALDGFENAEATRTWTRIARLDAVQQVRRVLEWVGEASADDPRVADNFEVLVRREVDGLSYGAIAAERDRGETAKQLRQRVWRLRNRIRERFPAMAEAG